MPTVLDLGPSLWRVYFAARDANNHSRIVYADLDPSRDMRLRRLNSDPLLDLGPPGTFDSAGMGPSAALIVGDRVFLYYVGMSLRRDVPYQLAIGLAISEDRGVSFHRAVAGPVLAIGPRDPFFLTAPSVHRAEGIFRMHYVSAVAWEGQGDAMDYRSVIRSARSIDGVAWVAEGSTVIGLDEATETAFGRPSVLAGEDGYRMWFCHRRGRKVPYRLGFAQSADGISWHRETVTFENPPQPADWDAEMQTYPCVVRHGGDVLVFYNGSGFGQTGLGFARVVPT